MNLKHTRLLRFFVPLGISFLILFLLFSKIDANSVIESLLKSEKKWIFVAISISIGINILLGAVKWRRILRSLGCFLTFREVLSIRTGCIPFKVIFPMKSSELLKAVYLKKQNRLGFTRSVSSLVLDKTLNLFVVIVVVLAGLMFSDIPVPRLILLALFIMITLFVFSRRTMGVTIAAVKRIHPVMDKFADNIASAFQEIDNREKGVLIGYSILYQSSEFLNTYILLEAVGVGVSLSALLIAVPIIMIIANLPITILGLGTREAAFIFFFSSYGTPAALLSGSILVSLIEHLLPVLFGLFFVSAFYEYFLIKEDRLKMEMDKP